jgi:ABC-2 type transport system ATP-binding protein
MLEIKKITKRYGSFTAIEEITAQAAEGSIYGLVGYNGAGKTTLLKTINGIYKPDAGVVTLDGEDTFDNAEVKGRLFFVPDDLFLLPQANMKRMARFYRGYYPRWNQNAFEKLSGIFKLDDNKRISGFSKGMQRQAYIIFALSSSADYLLLDEAFDGIDPMMRDLVRQLLLETIAERGTGVIISSHNLRELEDLCDRVGVLNGKHIVYDALIEDMRVNKNKYRVAFADAKDEAFIKGLGIALRQFKREGNIITFVADGASDAIKGRLAAQSPLLLEVLPLSLEEIFLIEMEAQTYDFTDLFSA